MHIAQLTGGVLTGGQGSRLQQVPKDPIEKGLVLLKGQPLVQWVASSLSMYCQSPLLLSANRCLDQYAAYGQVVTDPDYLDPHQGPLAGLTALLEHCTTPWLMVLPVDTPFVSSQLIVDLWAEAQQHPRTMLFYAEHVRSYPLCLLVHKKCLDSLRTYMMTGQRRVQSWLIQQGAMGVNVQHYSPNQFMNINTPADVKSAQLWARQLDTPVV